MWRHSCSSSSWGARGPETTKADGGAVGLNQSSIIRRGQRDSRTAKTLPRPYWASSKRFALVRLLAWTVTSFTTPPARTFALNVLTR